MMYEPSAQSSAFQPSVTSGTGGVQYAQTRLETALKSIDPMNERATIPNALDNQLQHLAELHKTINVLEERLQLILAPRPPDTNGTGAAPAPSGILQRIQMASSGIGLAGQRLQTLIDRVQL